MSHIIILQLKVAISNRSYGLRMDTQVWPGPLRSTNDDVERRNSV